MKCVQIRSFFWSECGKIRIRKNSIFGNFSRNVILSDSIVRGIRIYEFNKYIKYDRANLLTFPGATSRHLLHYLEIYAEDRNTETVIIHVSVNDIINGNSQSDIEKYISNVEKMVQKCLKYGVKKIFISGLVFSTKVSLPMLEQIHKELVEMSGFLDFEYIDNRNVRGFCLYKDGLHLLEEGKKFLANNVLSNLNRYLLGMHIHTHFPPHPQ